MTSRNARTSTGDGLAGSQATESSEWGTSPDRRTSVVLALCDDGVVFDRHYIVGDDAQGEPRMPGYLKHGRYGYPFLTMAGDVALVIYSTNKEDINIARFRLPGR